MSRTRARSSPSVRFCARIYPVWIIRYVDVPDEVQEFGGTHVAVHASCNGVPFRGTLVPRGGGRYRLALNAAVRRQAGGVDTGDRVIITLRQSAPRPIPPVPAELARALAAVPGGRLAFEAWPRGRRRAVLDWLGQAKGCDTRARRVRRILDRLGF